MNRLYYSYQFPPNKRASNATIYEQGVKAIEEAHETNHAIRTDEKAIRICEEAYDGIVALEGIIRKFPQHTRDEAYALVLAKGNSRDDWEADNDR